MAFVLLIIGITLLVAGVQDTQIALFTLLKGDFFAFLFWFIAIFLIGALGYIPKLKPLSVAFMTLVILVLFLSKGKGFFSQFTAALGSAQAAQPASGTAQPQGTTAGSGAGLGSLPSLPNLLTNNGIL
jgi:hypothetical protein